MCFKFIKIITNCKVNGLMKFDAFLKGLKVKNTLLALGTLPPVNEIDVKLHQELLTVMENRVSMEYDYLHSVLPHCLNNIMMVWYGTMHTPTKVFSVPKTASDVTL